MIVYEPVVALSEAEKDTVTVQLGLHGLFVKVAATPLGRPDAKNMTGVVVPLTRVPAMSDVGLMSPWTTLRLLGEGKDKLKSNSECGGVTVKVKVVDAEGVVAGPPVTCSWNEPVWVP